MATRTLQIVLSGDAASASRAFRRVGDDAEKMGKKVDHQGGRLRGFATVTSKGFSRVGVAAGGMATAGVGAAALLAKSFVSGASDISESLSKNRVLFGKHAEDIDKWSKDTAGKIGISRQAALDATGTFGNLFVALDIGPKKSAGMSKALTTLAGDLASFNNATPEEALEAIRSGLVGETEPLRKFGVNLNDAALRTEALRQGLIKNTKEALTPQQKALAVNALLFKQTEKAQGDFARTSGGLANQQRILKARLSDAGAELGGKLMPIALKVVKALNSLFSSSTSGGRAVQGMGRAAASAAGWLKNAWQTAVTAVRRFINRNRDDINSVVGAMRNLGKAAQYWFGEVVVPVVRTAFRAVGRIVKNIVEVLGGVVRLVSGILTGDWKKAWDGAKDVVKGAVRLALNVLRGAVEIWFRVAVTLGKQVVKGVGKGLNGLGDSIRERVRAEIKHGLRNPQDLIPAIRMGKSIADNLSDLFGDGIGKAAASSLGFMGSTGGPGSLMGADADLMPFASIAGRMGLQTSSGLRPGSITSSGNTSYHSSGDAIDESGPPGAMMRYFKFLRATFGSRLRELIYTPGGIGIKDGRPYRYTGQVAADHYDHVHVAYTGPFGDGPGVGDGLGRFTATSYGPPWGGIQGTGTTATGVNLHGNPHTYGIAVDPSVIPLGSRVKVRPNPFGYGGYFTAFDTGGAIKGNRIDFYDWRGRAAQNNWGRRSVTVWTEDEAPTAGERRAGHVAGGGLTSGQRTARQQHREATKRARQQHRGALGRARANAPVKMSGPGFGTRVKASPGLVQGAQDNLVAGDWDIPSATDFLDRDTALAALTPGTDDDIAAARAAKAYWEERLRNAQSTPDPRDDTEAANNLKAATDALTALTDAVADEKRAREEHTAALKAVADEMKRQTDLAVQFSSTSEFQKTKFIADIFSGQFGRGIVGRAFTPGTGVEVAY